MLGKSWWSEDPSTVWQLWKQLVIPGGYPLWRLTITRNRVARDSHVTPPRFSKPIVKYPGTPCRALIGSNQIDTYLTFEQNVAGDRLFSFYYLLALLFLWLFFDFIFHLVSSRLSSVSGSGSGAVALAEFFAHSFWPLVSSTELSASYCRLYITRLELS